MGTDEWISKRLIITAGRYTGESGAVRRHTPSPWENHPDLYEIVLDDNPNGDNNGPFDVDGKRFAIKQRSEFAIGQ